MKYFSDLETICKINSFTKNKTGVDTVGKQMKEWLESIGMKTITYKREKQTIFYRRDFSFKLEAAIA